MFKLAFYEYLSDIRGYYRRFPGAWILFYALTGLIVANLILTDNFGISFWLIYLGLLTSSEPDYNVEKHFPQIFSYIPLNEREKKSYIVNRVFVNDIYTMTLVVGLTAGRIMIGKANWFEWFVVWTVFVLCRQKMLFYKTYKFLNHSWYYSGMKTAGKVIYWIIRLLDLGTFVLLIMYYLDFSDEYGRKRQDTVPVIGIVCIGYQVASLIFFVLHVRTAMKRLRLPELIAS